MTREQILAIIPDIVAALRDEETSAKLAQAEGMQLMELIMNTYAAVLQSHGLNPMEGMQALQQAPKTFADDPEVIAAIKSAEAEVAAARGR